MHHPYLRYHGRTAFTLVEMAVVLVIIALLVGAITAGSHMVRQAEMQSVITDYAKYAAATAEFRQQYGGLPGDMIDATTYWPNATTGVTVGDGDGKILTGDEPYQAWKQLVLAKLLDGNYSGVAVGGGASINVNVPRSRITNAGFSFGYWDNGGTADADNYGQTLYNYLAIGKGITGGLTKGAALKPGEAWQIDKKMDDAIPSTGGVVSVKTLASTCVASNTAYALTLEPIGCSLNMAVNVK